MKEFVVLVDEADQKVGIQEKLAAHLDGNLHRAISVCIFNSQGEMLLQRRAFSKYHSGGLWTNTCCSHPRSDESPYDAARRRLWEEMGITCPLYKSFTFTYKAILDKNLWEHEFDHVFFGEFNGEPILNLEEAIDWKWMGLKELGEEMEKHPEQFTAWFKILLPQLKLVLKGSVLGLS